MKKVDQSGDSPLQACAREGLSECVKYLLSMNADVTFKNWAGFSSPPPTTITYIHNTHKFVWSENTALEIARGRLDEWRRCIDILSNRNDVVSDSEFEENEYELREEDMEAQKEVRPGVCSGGVWSEKRCWFCSCMCLGWRGRRTSHRERKERKKERRKETEDKN